MKNNVFHSFIKLIYHLICVPKCASCNARLSPFAKDNAFDHGILCLCDKCMEKWQKACAQMCHSCSKIASQCTCMPRKKAFTQPNIPSLFFYHPNTSSAESNVIYMLKHKNNLELFDFISAEICPKLEALLNELDISIDNCILTYIPRTKKALVKNGFDQGKSLCRATANKLDVRYAPLLTREGGKEQKKLSGNDRSKNADKAIYANTELKGLRKIKDIKSIKEFLAKRTVIIIDDVITTGATAERAIKALKSAGADVVLVCAVARGEMNTDSKKHFRK